MAQVLQFTSLPTAYDMIQDFAKESGINSESTRKAYLLDTLQFVKFTLGTEYATINELVNSINRKQVTNYRNFLLNEKGLQGTSVKRKLVAIKELGVYLNSMEDEYGFNINLSFMDSLQKIKATNNSYDVLSEEEALRLIEWIRNNERYEAEKKALYCELAFDTGIRANALNELISSSFIVKEDKVLIKGVDKGKKSYVKQISIEFYNRIYEGLGLDTLEGTLFNFSEQNRSVMIKRAKSALGWDNRNITFHSFKKGAVSYVYETTKDVRKAQMKAGHENVATTQRYLAEVEEDTQGSISNRETVNSKQVNFSDYNKEELVEVLSSLPEAIQLMIKKELIK